jgi:hypothetical protein
VSRASRLTQALETGPPFGDCHAADVRREAHRTAAEAAALPQKATASLQPEGRAPSHLTQRALSYSRIWL